MAGMDNAHALVVGIAAYRSAPALPPQVVQDARDIAAVLRDPRLCAFPPGHVQLLVDAEATGEALRRALAGLADRCEPGGAAFVYISAHGWQIAAGPHTGVYLLPVEAASTSDAESLASTAISGTELTEAFRAVRAGKLLAIFDCCHAAGAARPKGQDALTLRGGLPKSFYDALSAGRGRVILASSRDTEASYVLAGADNSLFTRHLLAGLRGAAGGSDGLIRVWDLFEYAANQVKQVRSDQHPTFSAADLEDNFPIALRRGGRKDAAPGAGGAFRYDAYISYVDREPDATWVWGTLVPRLRLARLRVVVSSDAGEPGVPSVVSVERGIRQARRTVVVLSGAYLDDGMAEFENALGQALGIGEGTYRVLPVKFAPFDERRLPPRLGMLVTPDLGHPQRAEREFQRLVKTLRAPLARTGVGSG